MRSRLRQRLAAFWMLFAVTACQPPGNGIVHAVPEGVRLAKVVIHETPRNSAEYFGPEENAGP